MWAETQMWAITVYVQYLDQLRRGVGTETDKQEENKNQRHHLELTGVTTGAEVKIKTQLELEKNVNSRGLQQVACGPTAERY